MLKDQCLTHDAGATTIIRCLLQGSEIQAFDACRAACLDVINQKLEHSNIFIYLYPFTLFGHPYTDPRSHFAGGNPSVPLVVSAFKHITQVLNEYLENYVVKGDKSTYTLDFSVPSGNHDAA